MARDPEVRAASRRADAQRKKARRMLARMERETADTEFIKGTVQQEARKNINTLKTLIDKSIIDRHATKQQRLAKEKERQKALSSISSMYQKDYIKRETKRYEKMMPKDREDSRLRGEELVRYWSLSKNLPEDRANSLFKLMVTMADAKDENGNKSLSMGITDKQLRMFFMTTQPIWRKESGAKPDDIYNSILTYIRKNHPEAQVENYFDAFMYVMNSDAFKSRMEWADKNDEQFNEDWFENLNVPDVDKPYYDIQKNRMASLLRDRGILPGDSNV